MSKIVRLTSENVKRLHVVEITPEGNVVIVGGDNGHGKTSVLDSIEMALGGTSSIPPEPIWLMGVPSASNTTMRLFPVSVTYTLPDASTANPRGP